ncbi:NAD(P)/FAD-dependent oxidoreductase [Oceanospirillum sediminis]|uniref:NAD(P)-binding protein n=1 Tax=Oceanospirillum sediminis TaxID=2760088 RepID=A0A839IXF9_9GAMM|nr:NAD(P)-binding protein [Oceanospirillum sediminis]MBB1488776.1 NAD(P)-binding protein [Oceanospirillum sediminis]
MSVTHVAVIGAGLAGCILARKLAESGINISVFEKSRGTGGRLASTRLGSDTADLGSVALTPDTTEFSDWLEAQQNQGQLHLWPAKKADFELNALPDALLYTGNNRLSALTRELLNHDNIQLNNQIRITQIEPAMSGKLLRDEQNNPQGEFDHVVIATPAPQATPLLETIPAYQALSRQVTPEVRWVNVIALPEPADIPYDWLEGHHTILEKAVRESHKPERSSHSEIWVLHATPEWSQRHMDSDQAWVADQLQEAFSSVTGQPAGPELNRCHRWLYSTNQSLNLDQYSLYAPDQGISVCGDWLKGHGFSASWHSAMELSQQLIKDIPAEDIT